MALGYLDRIRLGPARGYYFPEMITGAVERSHVDTMLQLGSRPPQSSEEMLRFMRSVADVIPAYRNVVAGLLPASLQLGGQLNCNLNSSLEVTALEVPADLAPLSYFHPLIRQSALMAPAPSGVDLPPVVRYASREATVAHLRNRFGWMEAVRVSLLFQIDQEMEAADITVHGMDKAWGLLGPTDLALYRSLRQGGLAAVALAYPLFLTAEERVPMDVVIDHIADELMEGGEALAQPWQSERLEVIPDMPRTTLDQISESLIPWDRGLFSKQTPVILPSRRREEIDDLLCKTIQTEADLPAVIRAIEDIAPRLAEQIMTHYRSGLIQIAVEPNKFGASLTSGFHEDLALGHPLTHPHLIAIAPGTEVRTVLPELVRALARTVVPKEVYELKLPSPRTDTDEDYGLFALYMEEIDHHTAAWAHTAVAEFFHQARGNDWAWPEDAKFVERAALLESAGYWILTERWPALANPQALALLSARCREYARYFIDAYREEHPSNPVDPESGAT